MARILIMVACGLLFLALSAAAVTAQAPAKQQSVPSPPTQSAANAAKDAKFAERDRLWKQARQLRADDKTAEAVAAGEKMLAIERELYPRPAEDLAVSLDWLGQAELDRENFPQAEKRLQEALDVGTSVFGADDWTVIDSRVRLEKAKTLANLSPEDRRDLRDAERQNRDVVRLYHAGQYAAAIEVAEKSADTRSRILGKSHPDYATGLNNLAGLYQSLGDNARAEPLFRQTLDIRKIALGKSHPDYAQSLNNLAGLYTIMGDYARAEPLCKQALELRRKTVGQSHPEYAETLINLAGLYDSMGDYARAEPLFRQAMEIRKKNLGEFHPDYGVSLNSLATLYERMGDHARAEPLLRQVLDIRKKALGEAHPDYAASLNNLAELYERMGDYSRAEPLLRQASEIWKKGLGEAHPNYAYALNNLAGLYRSMGDYARAEPLFRQAMEIRKKALGESHPEYAASLNNLAGLYENTGDHARAEPLYRQAMEIYKKALGESHPDYAASLNNLAGLYQSMGDYARAEPLYRQAATITLEALQQSFLGESQRQQLQHAADVRWSLDNYLAIQAEHGKDGDRVYSFWLQWKGLVLRQQLRQHALVDRTELRPKFAELEQMTTRLAQMALAVAAPEKREAVSRQLGELSRRKDQLERELAHGSAEFAAAAHAATVEALQKALPPNAVLVDFVEFWRQIEPEKKGGKPTWRRELAAFIVRHEGPIRLVSLGESKLVGEAIDRWRGQDDSDFGRSRGAKDAAKRLREQVWQPVEMLLAGAKLVLVSPDGPLDRLPFNALPGKEPDRYLLEDWPVAVVPSPAALAQPVPKPAAAPQGNLLVVADVDYDHRPSADTARPASPPTTEVAQLDRGLARSADEGSWLRLEGTLGELTMLKGLYADSKLDPRGLKLLDKANATTNALREAAGGYRYLHLATHGFFAAARFRSALEQQLDAPPAGAEKLTTTQSVSGYHPGLLSGLVLAGANEPQTGDTGYLTAEEVGTLDLRGVELAVLSACETGLGNVAGGEGLLGLQRAFQAAGARTVVASLWKVPDQATRLLMERFYKNLWQPSHNQPQITRLDALREAQLWMLREGGRNPDVSRGARGLTMEENSPRADKRLPPYFWAAFVLSGDWQ